MICSRKPEDAWATPRLQMASLRTGGLDVKPQSQGDLCKSPWPFIVATGRMTHPHKRADLILFSKPLFFFFFFVVLSRADSAPSTEAGVGFWGRVEAEVAGKEGGGGAGRSGFVDRQVN